MLWKRVQSEEADAHGAGTERNARLPGSSGFSRSMKGVWVGFAACILQQMKPGDRLAAHTERVTEGLIGCLNACADIPSLAQRDVVKELSSIAKATVAKERTIQTIDQVLANAMGLPARLHKLHSQGLVHTITCKQLILVAAAAFYQAYCHQPCMDNS